MQIGYINETKIWQPGFCVSEMCLQFSIVFYRDIPDMQIMAH